MFWLVDLLDDENGDEVHAWFLLPFFLIGSRFEALILKVHFQDLK